MVACLTSSADIDADYKLFRDGRESIRLTVQHYSLTDKQGGWLLHPRIQSAIANIPSPQIADVATGTGIWAIEVANRMPHACVTGLDISAAQFCPQWTWPSNCSFDLYDLLEDVPIALQGTFDVVHVRLLLSAGPGVDKSIFIDRFQKLLKPSGWLQWDELAYPNFRMVVNGQVKDLREYPVVKILDKHIGLHDRLAWVDDFEDVLSDAGFAEVKKIVAPVRPHLLQAETEMKVAVMTDLLAIILSSKAMNEKQRSEVRSAVQRMHTDRDEGKLFTYNWMTGIARKLGRSC